MRRWVVVALALSLAGLSADAGPTKAPREPEGFTHYYKILGRKPDTQETWLRAWWVHRDAAVGIAYAVIPREVPMHVHLDADHVITVLEGYAHVSVGGAMTVMEPGDTLAIPKGMAHAIKRGGQMRLVMLDVSTPAGDMAKTFWIEKPSALPPAVPQPVQAPSGGIAP